MVVWRTQEYDDLVYTDKGKLPFDSLQPDNQSSWKRPRPMLQSEGQAGQTEQDMVRPKRGFISIFFQHLDWPVYPSCVQCRKCGSIAKQVDRSVQGWDWVQVRDCYSVQLSVVDLSRTVSPFLVGNPIDEAHSILVCSKKSWPTPDLFPYFQNLPTCALRSTRVNELSR